MSKTTETIDEKVLRLRGEGQPYARISRDLGLERAANAQKAFRRALLRLPADDAQRVRGEELSRLNHLAERVRADTTRSEIERARQLKTIEQMKERISAPS